jgi:WD40 repeat protein
MASHQPIGQPLTGHSNFVTSVAFSLDGKTLASGSWDSTIIPWDVDAQSWDEQICQRAGRNFTDAEWDLYFPNEEYRATCPQWPLDPESSATP